MELTDALRTTGSVRAFLDEPVPDGSSTRFSMTHALPLPVAIDRRGA